MAHLKKSIVQVKTETNCLAQALTVAIANLTNDPDYNVYRQGRKIYSKVSQLLERTCISLDNGGVIQNSKVFRTIFGNVRSLCIRG